jgi:copper(I)-binding protein
VSDNASASITFERAWSRTSAKGQTLGVVYMKIRNAGATDDALVAVSVDASIAGGTEVHESYMVDDNAMTDDAVTDDPMTDMAGPGKSAPLRHGGNAAGTATDDPHGIDTGKMGMREVEKIVVPANGSVTLEPAGLHIMLLDLAKPLVAGESYDLTLTFERAGDKVVRVPILDSAPTA